MSVSRPVRRCSTAKRQPLTHGPPGKGQVSHHEREKPGAEKAVVRLYHNPGRLCLSVCVCTVRMRFVSDVTCSGEKKKKKLDAAVIFSFVFVNIQFELLSVE